ncbi:MAG: hypothetical protein LBB36_01400 [Fibromonadaceae bacterium]|jgi:hypothetical protein|nr:hypothetical protein [Fibromonadaceae bacterium]
MPSKKPVAKKAKSKKEPAKKTAKPVKKPDAKLAKAVKAAKPEKKIAAKKSVAKEKPKQAVKPAAKPKVAKAAKPEKTAKKTAEPKQAAPKELPVKIETSLLIQGAKFIKSPFFFDDEKENGKHHMKSPEKQTACSRPKISGAMDSKNLVEFLSQQLEFENKTFFDGCEGQICVKCNVNSVDSKYYVDKSLGYCTDCAMLLGLGQSKEGVFSDAQMELMRKSMQSAKDIDEDDIESALDEMDSLELEEALLAVEEEAEL